MTRISLSFALLLVSTACSSNNVDGTVQGAALEAEEAVFFNIDEQLIVKIRTATGICAQVKADQWSKNAAWMTLNIVNHDASGHLIKVAPGTFQIGTAENFPASESHAAFHKNDAACALTIGTSASSGTVTIDTLGDAKTPLLGSFDLHFDGDHVTGSFEAPLCDSGDTGGGSDAACL